MKRQRRKEGMVESKEGKNTENKEMKMKRNEGREVVMNEKEGTEDTRKEERK